MSSILSAREVQYYVHIAMLKLHNNYLIVNGLSCAATLPYNETTVTDNLCLVKLENESPFTLQFSDEECLILLSSHSFTPLCVSGSTGFV